MSKGEKLVIGMGVILFVMILLLAIGHLVLDYTNLLTTYFPPHPDCPMKNMC